MAFRAFLSFSLFRYDAHAKRSKRVLKLLHTGDANLTPSTTSILFPEKIRCFLMHTEICRNLNVRNHLSVIFEI